MKKGLMQEETNNPQFQSVKTIDTIQTNLFYEGNNPKKSNLDSSKKRGQYHVVNLNTIQKQYDLFRKSVYAGSRSTEYIIYYTIGHLIFRPMAIFNGVILDEFLDTIPYILRRSNGDINWLQFNAESSAILADYNFINGLHENVLTITIEPVKQSLIYVYGEMYHGFSFGFPSIIHLKGKLFLTRKDPNSGFFEEPIQNNCIVRVISGKLVVFICDNQEIAILTDNCRMLLKITADSASTTNRTSKIESQTLPLFSRSIIIQQKQPELTSKTMNKKTDSLSELISLMIKKKINRDKTNSLSDSD